MGGERMKKIFSTLLLMAVMAVGVMAVSNTDYNVRGDGFSGSESNVGGITRGVATFNINEQTYTAKYKIVDGIISQEYLTSKFHLDYKYTFGSYWFASENYLLLQIELSLTVP